MEDLYKKFRQTLTWEEFFEGWKIPSNVKKEEIKSIQEDMYNKYKVKSEALQRANFKCQNLNCRFPKSELTIHHIKFQRNKGEWKLRNVIVLCRKCQDKLHIAREVISLPDVESVPPHVRGKPLQIDSTRNIEWKKRRRRALEIQRECKQKGIRKIHLGWDSIPILMLWLYYPHYVIKNKIKQMEVI